MALKLDGSGGFKGTHTKTFEGQTVSHPIAFSAALPFADGVAVNQADLIWVDAARALAATSEEIDLSGSLTDAFGDAVVFAKVKGIYIKNLSVIVGETLKIGGAAANAFLLFDNATDIVELGPGGIFQLVDPSLAGLPVTAGTGDLLKIESVGPTQTYDICIIGTSS